MSTAIGLDGDVPSWYATRLARLGVDFGLPQPGGVVLAVGLDALRKQTGLSPADLEVLRAQSPWKKHVRRASLDCYVYARPGGGHVVHALSPEVVRRGFEQWTRVEAAVRICQQLRLGDSPAEASPLLRLTRSAEWPTAVLPEPLAIDIETADGGIERVSLAKGGYAGTFRWSDQDTRKLVARELLTAQVVVAWNAQFDRGHLEPGLEAGRDAVWYCAMEAHKVLYPGQNYALGHAAPMYAPTYHWKHLAARDMETYSTLDSTNLLPIYHSQQAALAQRGQLRYWEELRRPWLWRCARDGTSPDIDETRWSPGALLTWLSKNQQYTFGAVISEASNQTGIHLLEPNDCLGSEWEAAAARAALLLYLTGYGPRHSTKVLADLTEREIKGLTSNFVKANEAWVTWRSAVRAAAQKDGFLQNSFGRRAYGIADGEAERFLINSTLEDRRIAGLLS